MSPGGLKQSVQARDRLAVQAETAGTALRRAIDQGLFAHLDPLLRDNAGMLVNLAEDLRIYQAELHAQADELAASQARNERLLARFGALFGHMPVAALLVGDNGEVLEFNARAAALLGLQTRPGAARFLHRFLDPAQFQALVRPAFHEARGSGASRVDEVRFIDASGRGFPGELHLAWMPAADPLPAAPAAGGGAEGGDDGEALAAAAAAAAGSRPLSSGSFVCAVVDRSEAVAQLQVLRDSEQALRQSQGFLADSARLARVGGFEWLPAGDGWRFSPELCALLELPPGEAASLDALLARIDARQHEPLRLALSQAATGQPFELELDVTGASGRSMRMLAAAHGERAGADPAEPVQRVTGVLHDVTAPVRARQEISELTERLSVANAASGIGVWDWDLLRATVLLDARMAQLLGVAAAGEQTEPALRRLLAAALTPEDAQRLDSALQRLAEQAEPLGLELRRASADGQPQRWLHVTARAHFDGAGRAVRIVGSAWDSSADHEAARLLAAKESAEAASRSKSAFLSRMSHELRTPLNAILGFAQLMRMEAEAGDLVLKPHRVTLIETAARHLLDLVNEVLDVSRIETGQLDLDLVRFDLRDVVRESLPMVQGLAERNGVALVDAVAAQPQPLWVRGDRLRLKEVLINLLSNGAKYNRRGGQVRIDAQSGAAGVALSVADTGPGLTAEQQAQLFQPFNRLGAEASGIEGTGMGLFVSRRFVELMGGSIAVDSAPGQGCRFTVHLNAPPAT
jgi:signal transduction histidine kinase